MSDALLISIIGSLLGLVQILVAYIFRTAVLELKESINEMKERVDKREEKFDEYVKEKDKFDYQFRHNELAPRLTDWEMRLGLLEDVKSRVETLWKKAFGSNR